MASLRRLPNSRYWIACFTDATGRQRQRSTRTTDRATAQKVADSYEAAYRKRLTEAQIRRVMADAFREIKGESLCHYTLKQWFAVWLERTKPQVSSSTFLRYEGVINTVERLEPEIARRIMDEIEPKHFMSMRSKLMTERSRATTNMNLKIIRQCLKAAWMEGIISENPAARVPNVRTCDRQEGESRRPFTLEELRTILKAADDEWRGMIYAGLYTAGQRLGDIATMKASQVDLVHRIVRFSTGKTGRDVIVPVVDAWRADIEKRIKGKDPGAAVFPRASEQVRSLNGGVMKVSKSFRRLLFNVGLAENPSYARKGAVAGRRKVSPLSFHSFRHTATSLLKNSGVSDSIVMDIVGHESEAVSRNYTHIDDQTKRAALEKLPSL